MSKISIFHKNILERNQKQDLTYKHGFFFPLEVNSNKCTSVYLYPVAVQQLQFDMYS